MKIRIGDGEEIYDVDDIAESNGEEILLVHHHTEQSLDWVPLPLPIDHLSDLNEGNSTRAHVQNRLRGNRLQVSVSYGKDMSGSAVPLEYAWYLVKDMQIVQRCWYHSGTTHEWFLNTPGHYCARVFVRNKASGEIQSVTTTSVFFLQLFKKLSYLNPTWMCSIRCNLLERLSGVG